MSNSKGPSIYFKSDKSFFDALHSKSATPDKIRSALVSKNIYASLLDDKDDLIEYYCSLPLLYGDVQEVVSMISNGKSRERQSNSKVKCEIKSDDLKGAFDKIKKEYSEDVFSFGMIPGGGTKIKIEYVEPDFSKTELKQNEKKTIEIEVVYNKDSGESTFRYPLNKKAKNIVERLRAECIDKNSSNVEEVSITLEPFVQPEAKTKFFNLLMNGIEGYSFFDLSKAKVCIRQVENLGEDDCPDDGQDFLSETVPDESNDIVMVALLKDAILNGRAVTETEVFQSLSSQGYYISGIVWEVESQAERLKLEAGFEDKLVCSEFGYRVLQQFKFNERKSDYNSSHSKLTPTDIKRIENLIERASQIAYISIVQEFGNGSDTL